MTQKEREAAGDAVLYCKPVTNDCALTTFGTENRKYALCALYGMYGTACDQGAYEQQTPRAMPGPLIRLHQSLQTGCESINSRQVEKTDLTIACPRSQSVRVVAEAVLVYITCPFLYTYTGRRSSQILFLPLLLFLRLSLRTVSRLITVHLFSLSPSPA